MWEGKLLHIFIAELEGVEMEELEAANMIAGEGVEGDRYRAGLGHYSHMPHEDRQVTLIEVESLEALKRDHDLILTPQETRRNLVTSGVPLNHLVGRYFYVGNVLLYGGRLNVPCKYLEELLAKPVFDPLINRSGLNARIIESGEIRRGEVVRPADR